MHSSTASSTFRRCPRRINTRHTTGWETSRGGPMKAIAEIIEGHPLIHANPSDKVREVARMMAERNVGAIAVLDSGRLVGVFSERDLMARVVATGLDPDDTPVSNVMTKELIVAEAGEGVDGALQKMHEQI